MRLFKRYAFVAVLLGVAVAGLPAVADSETTPVEAINEPVVGPYPETHRWSPSQETVMAGDVVTFRNSTEVSHGVEWRNAQKPTCEEGAGKVPVGTTPAASAPKWSGTCKFLQAGTYSFYCTVHGASMRGTITVTNPGEPTATTEAATAVTETSATLKGTVNPDGHQTSYHFIYGRALGYENPPTPTQTLAAGSTPGVVSASLTGLVPGTTYHFQLVAENTSGTAHGADQVFTTASPPGPPLATTGLATAVSETGATLKGTVNPDGRPTEYFFEWGTSNTYGQLTTAVQAGEDHVEHPVSATLSSLAPGTAYHFRLVARNTSSEVAHGPDQALTTLSSPPPPTTTTPPSMTTPPTPTPLPMPLPSKVGNGAGFGAPLVGASLKLTAPHHASTLRGSIQISQAGAGGRLEVDLLAKGASLAKKHSGSKPVAVGRIVRQTVPAGTLSFVVALTVRAKHALTRHHSLPLTVKVTLTPQKGQTETLTRSVTLHS